MKTPTLFDTTPLPTDTRTTTPVPRPHNGTDTSREAAQKIAITASNQRTQIKAATFVAGDDGVTLFEIQDYIESKTGTRPAKSSVTGNVAVLCDSAQAGGAWLYKTTERRTDPATGFSGRVWKHRKFINESNTQ